jgi:hypothetical protein
MPSARVDAPGPPRGFHAWRPTCSRIAVRLPTADATIRGLRPIQADPDGCADALAGAQLAGGLCAGWVPSTAGK